MLNVAFMLLTYYLLPRISNSMMTCKRGYSVLYPVRGEWRCGRNCAYQSMILILGCLPATPKSQSRLDDR